MNGLRVGRSRIHGYGLITTRPFAAGELLLLGDGVLWREEEEFDDTYALITPGYETNQGDEEGPPMFWDLACQSRWINHSCNPNSAVDTKWIAQEERVEAWWTALRDIPKGEELTYDYAFSAECAEICYCRTPSCRGLIVDDSEMAQVSEELAVHLKNRPTANPPPASHPTSTSTSSS